MALLFILFTAFTLANAQGKVVGGSMHEGPEWFKESFLELEDDIEEAKENNKHIMLFLDLDGCPYCTRMLKENFIEENKTSEFIQKYFDVINLNVKGSREIVWGEEEFTEKELATKLNIQYSPTILFLDYELKTVVRVNGYRSPVNFQYILKYVQGKHYENLTLSQYANKIKDKSLYTLKSNEMFKDIKDLSKIKTPLAVIFEDGSCTQCDYFHNKTLKNEEVKSELSKFQIVRLDANSNETIIDTNGKETSPKKWVESINLDYRPGMLLLNEGKVINTVDALLYSFHFKELLRYVSGRYYIKHNGDYLDYLRQRQADLLNQGKTIDLRK
jgi:thioredoxin-related protein